MEGTYKELQKIMTLISDKYDGQKKRRVRKEHFDIFGMDWNIRVIIIPPQTCYNIIFIWYDNVYNYVVYEYEHLWTCQRSRGKHGCLLFHFRQTWHTICVSLQWIITLAKWIRKYLPTFRISFHQKCWF